MAGKRRRQPDCSVQGHVELTEYELQRLRRIEENERVLQSMGLKEAGARFKADCCPKPAKVPQRKGKSRDATTSAPTRRSLRVQGVKAEPVKE